MLAELHVGPCFLEENMRFRAACHVCSSPRSNARPLHVACDRCVHVHHTS